MFKDIFVQLLQNNGISSYKLTKDTGINNSLISKWKKGSSTPSADMLVKLSDYFNVSVDYLLGMTENPSPPKKGFSETDRLNYDISTLSPDDRKKAEEYIQLLKTREDFERESAEKHARQSPKLQT